MRPTTLDEVVGQRHLVGEGGILRRVVASGHIPNMVFYGPSGVGKTTIAQIISNETHRTLHKLNGTNASVADVKAVVGEVDTLCAPGGVLLYLDEIQYFNKKQQQTLLECIESGAVTLIASTTENPYFYVYGAILSRSTVFEFKALTAGQIVPAVVRAFQFLRDEKSKRFEVEDGVCEYIAQACGGDVRKAINAAELCFLSRHSNENNLITLELAKELTQKSALRYDREGDEHYDIISAFQKSMRGSDPDAAVHYLARLLEAGDLPSACRRLMVTACEDVGLAWPQVIPIVKAAVDAAQMVGLPEAALPLADAVILVATAPKSNSACGAVHAAMADIQAGKSGPVPRNLQNKHYDGADSDARGQNYLYAHSYQNHWVAQQYLPDALKGRVYYQYGDNKSEQAAKAYWDRIKGG